TPRVPKTQWYDGSSRPGWLAVTPLPERLDAKTNMAFYARRQQHLVFEASTALELPAPGVAAGLAAFQGDDHWYFLGVRRGGDQGVEVFLEKKAGGEVEVVASQPAQEVELLTLHIKGNEGSYGFGFDAGNGEGVTWLVEDADGTILSTDVAGGSIGATLGPHARLEPTRCHPYPSPARPPVRQQAGRSERCTSTSELPGTSEPPPRRTPACAGACSPAAAPWPCWSRCRASTPRPTMRGPGWTPRLASRSAPPHWSRG